VVFMSTRVLAFVVAVATIGPPTAVAQPPTAHVRATDPILVREGRFQYVDYLLTNDSPQAITAWGVEYQLTKSDGTTRNEAHGKDVYKSFQRGCDTRDLSSCFVPPGQAHRVRFIASSKEEYVSVRLQLEFAIFSDGSGVGSERWRSDLFEHRNAESRGWKQVLAILLSAREEAGPGVEGTQAAIRELDKVQAQRGVDRIREYETRPRSIASGNLRRGIGRDDHASQPLDDMIQMAGTEIEMLEPHLTARPSSLAR
jgi:hypothetical protein